MLEVFVFLYLVINMNVSYLVASLVTFAILLQLSKHLRATKSVFIIPSSADLAISVSLLSILLFSKISIFFIILMSVLISYGLTKASHISHGPLLLKVIGYTIVLLIIPYISYETYSYVESLVTGFLYLTPQTIDLIGIDLVLLVIFLLFNDTITYSVFDTEFAKIAGLRPEIWISTIVFGSVIIGFTMTFMYGFLIAHVMALSATNIKNKRIGMLVFTMAMAILSINIPAALAAALGSVIATVVDKVLLLRKTSSFKMSKM